MAIVSLHHLIVYKPRPNETWIADIFSELTPKDVRELMRLLAKTKGSAQRSANRRVP